MIENMQMAIGQIVTKHNQKTLFACLFCGGAKACEQLKSTGVNALCLSWGQIGDKPKLSKIIPILENLILKSDMLTNAVVVCSEHSSENWTSMIILFILYIKRYEIFKICTIFFKNKLIQKTILVITKKLYKY